MAEIGTPGDDTILGTGQDLIWGDLDGTLFVVGGNDRIFGLANNDQLTGDAKTIAPEGRGGDDFISGGDGDDPIFGDASETLWGWGGNDTIYQDAGSAPMAGDAGTLGAGAHGGADRLFGGGLLYGDASGNMNGAIGGNDVLDADAATEGARLFGDSGTIMSGKSLGGRDKLDGSSFGDLMMGDAFTITDVSVGGKDTLSGWGGADKIYGDADTMGTFARGGNDILRGGAGNDELYGDAGLLFEFARCGNDRLLGGAGDDQLWGDGRLNQSVVGGADQFEFSGSFGKDKIFDFRQGDGDVIRITGHVAAEVNVAVVGTDTVLSTLQNSSITLVGFTGELVMGVDVIFA